jgi:hypothetical protein
VRAQLDTRADELLQREIRGSFFVFAGGVEEGPLLAEMIVLFFISAPSSQYEIEIGNLQNTPYAPPSNYKP